MSYLVLEDFRRGLDPRKFKLGAPAGTLVDFVNGHITNAGDIEKRKAFVEFSNLAILDSNGDQGIFGLQETATGITVFGHCGLFGTSPTLSQPTLASAIPTTSPVVTYQKLTHPAILEGETYDRTKHRITKVWSTELYGGTIQAVAEFADGRRFGYSNGVFIEDYATGLVLPHLNADNTKWATHLTRILNLSDSYTAAQLTFTTTNRARAANVATLTVASTTGIAVGSKIRVAGVGGTGYNSSLVTVTAFSPTTIQYANTGSNEGTTADTGGTITTSIITVTGDIGVEWDLDITKSSSAGTLNGPTNTQAAVVTVAGASALGSFTITGGSANGVTPTAATGTVTRTATNASAADYIQIGKKKYTFVVTPTVEGDVKIGANALASQTNLLSAINHSGTPGTDYVCARAHPWVRAGAISGNNLPLTAFKGSQGSSIALSESTATVRFSVTAFSGGAGNCIGSVKVVKPDGTETELLSAAIQFTESAVATAALVRDNITAFVGTSGYTATVNQNTVTILSATTASPMPNGYSVQVAGGGDVLIGECLFYLTQQATTFTLNTMLVDGVDCFGGAAAFSNPTAINAWASGYPSVPVDNLTEYYQELVKYINRRAGISGINAWTEGTYVKLSRISTRDDDQPLTVYLTPAAAQTVGVVFGKAPDLALPLSISLPETVVSPGSTGVFVGGAGSGSQKSVAVAVTLTPTIIGGNGLYTFEWLTEYTGSDAGVLQADILSMPTGVKLGEIALNYAIAITPTTTQVVQAVLTATSPTGLGPGVSTNWDIQPVRIEYQVRVRITDSFGNKATSNACKVEFDFA